MTGWGTANKAVCQTSNSFSLTACIFIFLSDHLVGNPTSQQSPLVHKCSVKHSSPVVTVNVRLIILILLGRVGTEAQTLLMGQKQNITGPGGDSLGNRGQSFVLYNSDKREKHLSSPSLQHLMCSQQPWAGPTGPSRDRDPSFTPCPMSSVVAPLWST